MSARYRAGLPLCLKQVSFSVRDGESIGIVGRTGSGKSSLIAALFRLIETESGSIWIDGLNTSSIGLERLVSQPVCTVS